MNWWPFSGASPNVARAVIPGFSLARLRRKRPALSRVPPLATAALEEASGLYGRCLAAAVVTGSPVAENALTPPVLALMARNLIRRGEDHHRIVVRDGRIELRPLAHADVRGQSADPLSWIYAANEYGPTGSAHTWLPAASVIHCRYAVDASRPWLGVAPWAWAAATSKAIAGLEAMVANEASAPYGYLLGLPETPQVDEDGDVKPLDAFRSDLSKAKGGTLVMEQSGQWGTDPAAAGSSKLEQAAFGLDRAHVAPLRTATALDVLGACGVPPTLFVANSDGTAQREAFRRFLHAGLRPVARLMEAELRVKLDAPDLVLDLSEIHAADVAGRARSFKAFVEAGVAAEDAARIVGVGLAERVA